MYLNVYQLLREFGICLYSLLFLISSNNIKETPLTCAIRENSLDIVQLLVEYGADVNHEIFRFHLMSNIIK